MVSNVLHLAYNIHDKLSGELHESFAAFKAARLVWPQKTVKVQPTSQDVDALQAFPFLKGSVSVSLKNELPTYIAKAADLVNSLHAIITSRV